MVFSTKYDVDMNPSYSRNGGRGTQYIYKVNNVRIFMVESDMKYSFTFGLLKKKYQILSKWIYTPFKIPFGRV